MKKRVLKEPCESVKIRAQDLSRIKAMAEERDQSIVAIVSYLLRTADSLTSKGKRK